MSQRARTSIVRTVINGIPRVVVNYGVATVGPLLSLFLRYTFIPVLGDRAPFTFFWLAIIIAGIVGGVGPGLFATFLAGIFVYIFFLPPWSTLATDQRDVMFSFMLFMAQGTVLSVITGRLMITRQRMMEELKKRNSVERQLRVQYIVAGAIAEAPSFDIGVPRILESIVNGLDYQLGQWWQVEPETRSLTYTTSYTTTALPATAVRAFEILNRQIVIAPGVGVLGESWQSRAPQYFNTTSATSDQQYESAASALGLRHACTLPVVGQHGLVGIMVFWRTMNGKIDAPTMDLMETLGQQLSQFYDRNRASSDARASEARKSAILSAAMDGIITIDSHGIVREWNPAATSMFGFTAQRAIGTLLADLIIPPAIRDAHRNGMERYLTTGKASVLGRAFEIDAQRADGSTIPIELSIIRLPTDGNPLFTGFIRDLTHRNEAQNTLHFQAQLLDSVEEAVIATDPHGTITYWNRFAQTLYGWSATEVIGKNVTNIVVPPRARSRANMVLRMLAQGESWSGEWRVQRRDGSIFPAILTNAPVYYQHGELVGFVGITRDISERKRVEEANRFLAMASVILSSSLEETEILNQLTALTVPRLGEYCALDMLQDDGSVRRVAMAHADAEKLLLAREIERRYGIHSSEKEGPARVLREGRSLLYRDLPPIAMERIAQDADHLAMLKTLALRSIISVPLIARGRTLGTVSLGNSDARQRFDDDDLHLFEDLALRAGLAIDNARLYKETQSAVQLRDEFLSVAAHELRTPVTSVLAYSQMLNMHAAHTPSLDGRTQRAIQTIESQTERLSRLISSLLDVSRLSNGHFHIDAQRLDIRDLLGRIAYETAPTLAMHQVRLEAPPDPVWINGDPQRLEQMLQNLVQNAVKYSPLGGDILLRLTTSDGMVSIDVKDHGVGIPQAALPYIFHRFFRAANSAYADTAGMGIGLYVVHEIVTRHGGTITVVSEEGRGTMFTVSMPLESDTPFNERTIQLRESQIA